MTVLRVRSLAVLATSITVIAGAAASGAAAHGVPTSDPADIPAPLSLVTEQMTPSEQLAAYEAQAEFTPVVDDVIEHGASDAAFSTLTVDPIHKHIWVYRVPGLDDPYADSYADIADDRADITVVDALLTASQNDALTEQFTAAVDALRATGITVNEWGPAVDGGPYRVMTDDPDADGPAIRDLLGRFGKDTITVLPGGGVVPLSRLNDPQPYKGGARVILPAQQGTCSTGFGAFATSNSRDYVLTAWHCVDLEDPRFWTGASVLMGSVPGSSTPTLDAAFIKIDYGTRESMNRMYYGTTTSSLTYNVTSVRGPVTGEFVSTSGSHSGSRGPAQIGAPACSTRVNNLSNGFPSATVCGRWVGSTNTAFDYARPGDSGGSMFTYVSPNAQARGIISGGRLGYDSPCSDQPAITCYAQVLMPSIIAIQSAHNVNFIQDF